LTIPFGPFDQRKIGHREDVLKFATEPLEKPIDITGHVRVRLYVSSDAPDTDSTAKLIDVYPDGREILMLDGIQRLKLRHGFSKPDPLPPGEIDEVEIDLWSISLIINKGHRIGLHVSSSNYPRFEVNPNNGDDFPSENNLAVAHNTIYMDKAHPSALILPLPAQEADTSSRDMTPSKEQGTASFFLSGVGSRAGGESERDVDPEARIP